MFIDARSVPNGAVVEAEVCVVGAGAAGITLAREFNNCRRASGKRWERVRLDTKDLYAGRNIGRSLLQFLRVYLGQQ